MRIKEPFAQERKSGVLPYKTKHFIISEGSVTEPTYFSKLNESLISENVNIISILRDYAKINDSNPKNLINILAEFLKNRDEDYS